MNLIDAMRTEYGRGKLWWNWSLGLSLSLYPLAILSVFYSDGWKAKVLGIIAFLMQLLFLYKQESHRPHWKQWPRPLL